MGEGEVLGRRAAACRPARRSRPRGLRRSGSRPKEGLAFINGTQAQTALLALLVHDARVLWRTAVGAAAMSLEALRGTPAPLDPRIHAARPHRGPDRGRGPDAARCWPTARSGSRTGRTTLGCRTPTASAARPRCSAPWRTPSASPRRRSPSSSTPRPTTRWSSTNGEVISGGNFHGQPVAQALDILAMTLTTLQAIAERRVERLVNPDLSQGLPAFLTGDPGSAQRLHDGADHGGLAGRGVAGHRHAGQHRLDSDRRQPGGLRAHGDGGGLEGAADPGQRPAGGGRRAPVRGAGARVPQAARRRAAGWATCTTGCAALQPAGAAPRGRPAARARPRAAGPRGGRTASSIPGPREARAHLLAGGLAARYLSLTPSLIPGPPSPARAA